jgi:DNA-binding XRE family transcriptional regulator
MRKASFSIGLRRYRKSLKQNQSDFGEMFHLEQSVISNIENEKIELKDEWVELFLSCIKLSEFFEKEGGMPLRESLEEYNQIVVARNAFSKNISPVMVSNVYSNWKLDYRNLSFIPDTYNDSVGGRWDVSFEVSGTVDMSYPLILGTCGIYKVFDFGKYCGPTENVSSIQSDFLRVETVNSRDIVENFISAIPGSMKMVNRDHFIRDLLYFFSLEKWLCVSFAPGFKLDAGVHGFSVRFASRASISDTGVSGFFHSHEGVGFVRYPGVIMKSQRIGFSLCSNSPISVSSPENYSPFLESREGDLFAYEANWMVNDSEEYKRLDVFVHE